ncbi:ERG24 reductase, partial [Malurus elegans]|nr:ERG24 reductase [Malurus elegans]
ALGMWIFHGATTQRSLFSHDPRDPRVAGEMPWPQGSLSLGHPDPGTPQIPASPPGGWWGLVRRPDDLGELLMTLGWTLPCGEIPPQL